MGSTPISQETANEIARVIKSGGRIRLSNFPDPGGEAKRYHQRVIDAVGKRGKVTQTPTETSLDTVIEIGE
jgi:hypothetical protein